MTEEPSHGEEYGPCAICGKTAMPKFGHFLCRDHATLKHAKIVDSGRYSELDA